MQHPTLTLIVRYPNDTLQLATQEHLKNKVIVKCEECGQVEVVDRHIPEVTCKSCSTRTAVKGAKGINCRRQNCNGELKLMLMMTGLMIE